jgi:hypothetical protein
MKMQSKIRAILELKGYDLCYDSLFWQLVWVAFNRLTGLESETI